MGPLTDPENPSPADGQVLRLLLVDAHDRSRRSSRLLLDSLPGLSVVAETGDHAQALSLCAQHQPDLVLMGMRVRGASGPKTTRVLLAQSPKLPVVFLSFFESKEYVEAALQAGARGYVLKQSTAQDLVAALHAALQGQVHLGAGVQWDTLTQDQKHPTATRQEDSE